MKQLVELQNKNYSLETKLKTITSESEKNQQTVSKLNDLEVKFVKMLTPQKAPTNKRGIGFNNANDYKNHTTFVIPH